MVTAQHEAPIQIIRDNPDVVAQLLRAVCPVELPDDVLIRSISEEFTQIAPTAYRADNVVEVCEGGSSKPSIAIIAETQRDVDDGKRYSWPLYLTALHGKARCPCYLIVLCPRRTVADWARKSIAIGHPGFALAPLVIGPGTGPLVTTTAQAAQAPELAIVATLANVASHDRDAMEITHAALATLENAGHENADMYTDMVLAGLSKAARSILEELVTTGTAEYKFKSDFVLRNQAIGEMRGEVRGEAKSVLKILAARGVTVSDEVRERVLACEDEERLDVWLMRAGSVESADDLFH
ncbi:hypothetical protein [Actinomadura sp. WMMB 499]|uniref:hypothetical protein n=1 Tax=Actinomadura sp. WMMB 499 TaxID=1219491 RepID=UPI001244E118|nr:hypothetical protein [Actinomadura sp. WMMB 499]QFG25166.1 hypothetical protein F7P10_32535 [Actinomadura sp. WMMB 499]